jgi:hypothetical protein
MRQTSLIDAVWIPVKDGNDTGREIFNRHYSRRYFLDGRRPKLYVGPGEKLVLLTPDALALFVWRKFISMDRQEGINCAVFRNEGLQRSSDLIRIADAIAWERWKDSRHYTYVDPRKVRHKRDPGRCFLRAGWNYCGRSKSGLLILEIYRNTTGARREREGQEDEYRP